MSILYVLGCAGGVNQSSLARFCKPCVAKQVKNEENLFAKATHAL
jgi:hypothetical protein